MLEREREPDEPEQTEKEQTEKEHEQEEARVGHRWTLGGQLEGRQGAAEFVRHPGQQSEDKRPYRREMDGIRERIRPWDVGLALLDALIWLFAPPRAKKLLNPRLLYRWDDRELRWK